MAVQTTLYIAIQPISYLWALKSLGQTPVDRKRTSYARESFTVHWSICIAWNCNIWFLLSIFTIHDHESADVLFYYCIYNILESIGMCLRSLIGQCEFSRKRVADSLTNNDNPLFLRAREICDDRVFGAILRSDPLWSENSGVESGVNQKSSVAVSGTANILGAILLLAISSL